MNYARILEHTKAMVKVEELTSKGQLVRDMEVSISKVYSELPHQAVSNGCPVTVPKPTVYLYRAT